VNDLNRPIHHWRSIVAAVLAFGAAAVVVFACLSGPSSAAPVSDSTTVSGVNERVPDGLQGSVGGDVGSGRVDGSLSSAVH
jgi:hypothetical protein